MSLEQNILHKTLCVITAAIWELVIITLENGFRLNSISFEENHSRTPLCYQHELRENINIIEKYNLTVSGR